MRIKSEQKIAICMVVLFGINVIANLNIPFMLFVYVFLIYLMFKGLKGTQQ